MKKILITLFLVSLFSCTKNSRTQKILWEYKVEKFDSHEIYDESKFEKELNNLGLEGWEFAFYIKKYSDGSNGYAVFKKPTFK